MSRSSGRRLPLPRPGGHLAHQLAHDDSKAITGSYSYRLFHGFYVNAGPGYVNHPSPLTYTRRTGRALNVIAGIAAFF